MKQVPSSDSSHRPALHLTHTRTLHMHARASLHRHSHESGVTGPWSCAIRGKCSANCRSPTVGERCDSSRAHMEPGTESSATHRTSGGKRQRDTRNEYHQKRKKGRTTTTHSLVHTSGEEPRLSAWCLRLGGDTHRRRVLLV